MKLNLICERKNSGSEKASDKKDFIGFEKKEQSLQEKHLELFNRFLGLQDALRPSFI